MNATDKNISRSSSALLLLGTILLAVSVFVPIWRIDLDAPQYPEGLRLLIYANKLAGNVDIINGLNHYIGMHTLHTEDFIEFTVLPYLIGTFALLSLVSVLIRRKWFFYSLFTGFVLFGIVAMIDFWRWEYNYGHNLDPNAAIIVPGMAYQPPLIGFKQLLNFGAYSVPDLGGWLFVATGVLMLTALLLETRILKIKTTKVKYAMLLFPALFLFSCSDVRPEAAKLNVDGCDNCKMTISDAKFVAELITARRRIYKFDDLSCMQTYRKENPDKGDARLYISDFEHEGTFLPVEDAIFVCGEDISSPMGGNTAAFSTLIAAEQFAKDRTVQILMWSDIQHK